MVGFAALWPATGRGGGIVTIAYAASSGAGAPPGERGYAFDKGIWPRAPQTRVDRGGAAESK